MITHFTKTEFDFIEKNISLMSISKIALHLNISRTAIYTVIRKNENIKQKLIDAKNEYLKPLTQFQKSVFYGCMLGDSCLEKKRSETETSRFMCKHSTKQTDYLEYKKSIFKNYVANEATRSTFDERTQMVYSVTEFRTHASDEFGKYRKQFYPNGKKILTQDIISNIDEIGLAFWFMDDGCFRGMFATMCFEESELELCKTYFLSRFGLNVKITKSKCIQIIKEDLLKFETLIFPHLHKTMYYKLVNKFKNV
jgi:hypothetical protein